MDSYYPFTATARIPSRGAAVSHDNNQSKVPDPDNKFTWEYNIASTNLKEAENK